MKPWELIDPRIGRRASLHWTLAGARAAAVASLVSPDRWVRMRTIPWPLRPLLLPITRRLP